MIKYAHVGYPKAASTWLQIFLFPRHPDVKHFGRHNGDDIVNDDMRIALWNDLIARPSLLYDPRVTASTFEKLFAEAAKAGAKACGISQEVLTLSMVGGVDITERARRLRGAMGADSRIVLIIRNQLDWIHSVFCGLLKEGGMTIELPEFLFYFYYQQDQSPFSTLFYDDVYSLYADLFGAKNVRVIPYELIKRDAQAFSDAVCDAIGIAPLPAMPAQSVNERPSAKALTASLAFNRERRFFFGGHWFRRPLAATVEPVFRQRMGIEPPSWVAEERAYAKITFERVEDLVKEAERQGKMIPAMDTTFPPDYQRLLSAAYAPHNARLEKLLGLDLRALGYPVG